MLALIIDQDGLWSEACRAAFKSEEFRVIFATSGEDAIVQARDFFPHVILFVDHTSVHTSVRGSFGFVDRTQWLQKLDPEVRAFALTAILSAQSSPENVAQMLQLGVKEYILKGAGKSALEYRIWRICREAKNRAYLRSKKLLETQRSQEIASTLSIEGHLVGISETGICVDSRFTAARAAVGFECVCPIFQEFHAKSPLLRLVNSRKMRPVGGRMPSDDMTSFFQIQGWGEADRRGLRAWSVQSRLDTVHP